VLFNSLAFFVFAAIFFAAWPLVRKRSNVRFVAITIASFIFYGFWDPRFLLLLIGTGLSDFFFGLGIERYAAKKKLLLAASLTVNLGALFTFKYSSFALGTLDRVLSLFGKETHLSVAVPAFFKVLPPGISFYTFQSMSYTIDVYRGRLRPTKNPLHFFAFISMFPQLVAGPIVRAKDLLPALADDPKTPDASARFAATQLIVLGYFKKCVVADNLASAVAGIYAAPAAGTPSFVWWMGTLMFAMQIYCDFSGYSDIARGLARFMGYEFPLNFNHPYASQSFREFWTRWHITLSTWFRDYVYIPLGGNRVHTTRNLWVTMLLSGLWHGASFTYVAWGAWHALMLTIERATKLPERAAASPVGRALAAPVVFVLTLVGWVFFRAESLGKALAILRVMLGSMPVVDFTALSSMRAPLFFLSVGIVAEVVATRLARRGEGARPRPVLAPLGLAALVACCIYLRGPGNAFIYFQF
jgi:D-alanyl-lipoteichoic acid acyltransferase DltB (MBOAT superfamily)